jgi:hypothetical protein
MYRRVRERIVAMKVMKLERREAAERANGSARSQTAHARSDGRAAPASRASRRDRGAHAEAAASMSDADALRLVTMDAPQGWPSRVASVAG